MDRDKEGPPPLYPEDLFDDDCIKPEASILYIVDDSYFLIPAYWSYKNHGYYHGQYIFDTSEVNLK